MSSSKQLVLPVGQVKIIDNRRFIRKLIEHQDFIGFDTETYLGACKLLADSEGRHVYNPDFKDCLDFLWYKASQSYYRCFWNLDFDLSSILKLHDNIDDIEKLVQGYSVMYENYKLGYLRPKMFTINKGKKTIFFTDLWFMYKLSLENASAEFLNKHKIDNIDGNLLNTKLTYWIKNLDDIIKYCKQDAKLTADLGKFLLYKLRELKLPAPKFFTSHASLSKQFFRKECRIPSVKYIPLNILDIAYHTYFGGRFEVLQKGYFDKLYYYDINSAYPATIRDLPSLKHGTWYKSYEIPKKETIGFYKVIVDIPKSYVSAYPIKWKNLLIFPDGVFENWLTWYEVNLLKPYIVSLEYGYEYEPASNEYYPFRKAIDYLFSLKAKYKGNNPVFYWIFKIVMNSLYGCFIEKHKKLDGSLESGILFNSVYASIITAKTRYKLLKDVNKKNWKNIVAFHTDSVISTVPLKSLKLDDKIGNWSLETIDKGIILLTGVYQIGKQIRKRGFSKPDINWFDLLKEFSEFTEVNLPKLHVVKIAEALRRWHSVERVNLFIEQNKKLNINSDKKRLWNRPFKNCQDALDNNISSKTLTFRYICEKELV
jgi:hypothetical protein